MQAEKQVLLVENREVTVTSSVLHCLDYCVMMTLYIVDFVWFCAQTYIVWPLWSRHVSEIEAITPLKNLRKDRENVVAGGSQPWPLCNQNHIFDVTIWFANVCNILWLAMILYQLYDYHTNKYDYDLHWIFACCSYVGSRCWIPEYFTLLYRCGALGSTTMWREAFHQHLKGVQLPMNDEQEQKSRTKMDGKQILFGNPAKRFEEDVKIFFLWKFWRSEWSYMMEHMHQKHQETPLDIVKCIGMLF